MHLSVLAAKYPPRNVKGRGFCFILGASGRHSVLGIRTRLVDVLSLVKHSLCPQGASPRNPQTFQGTKTIRSNSEGQV